MKGNKALWLTIGVIVIAIIAIVAVQQARQPKEEKVIKIGAILPLTGKSARYGQYIMQGLELAREEINKDGGINGRQLTIIYEDDQADPKIAAAAMSKLAEVDRVPLVFGSWASSCVLSQAPIAERTRTVVLAIAISPKIREAGDFIFRIQPDARLYLQSLVPFVYDTLGVRKVGILYVNNDFGVDQANVFRNLFERKGGQVVYLSGFPQGMSDFRSEVAKLRSIRADALFVPAYTEIGFFLKQLREAGNRMRVIASVPFENPEILQVAGRAAEGVIYPYHYSASPRDDLDAEFRQKYQRRYGSPPDGFAALSYDGLKIVAHVLRKAGADSERIKEELYKIREFPGVTGPASFDEYGDVVKPIIIKTVHNGAFEDYASARKTSGTVAP